ncbi:hypothetical protein E1B28_001795 [Marasmius oreades]|uniref:Protein kinase domain-containing protein n=1 Tax=Marasmius oreades TaxID=181124 RepID=A0A9P7V4A7_9AGAR|nr:uncharacterized protein E1B28_001795 [Marasmius oreades]KAG7100008.1 hypothetical protein E1B28_001795 [Marasmius oreades]
MANCLKARPGQVALLKEQDQEEFIGVAKLTNEREVRILRQLQFLRGVVKIKMEKELEPDVHLLITHYAGQDLKSYCLCRVGPGPPAMGIVVGLLTVVQNVHNAGFVHLDIKPANVVVPVNVTDTSAILLDFGLACSTEETLCGPTGTQGWMAPEVEELEENEENEEIDLKLADIWSLGKVLLFMTDSCTFTEQEKDLAETLGKRMISVDPDERPSLADVLSQVWQMVGHL